jgi:hypothetical protein
MKLTQAGNGAPLWGDYPKSRAWLGYFTTSRQLHSSWLAGGATLLVACVTAPASTRNAQSVDDAQMRFTAAVTECQRQHSYTVSEAVRENEPSGAAEKTLTACLERARTDLELGTGQAQR